MERNRTYLKFVNVFRPQFIQLIRPQIINMASKQRRPVLFKVVNSTSLSAALINHRPLPLQMLSEIKSTKMYKRLKVLDSDSQ